MILRELTPVAAERSNKVIVLTPRRKVTAVYQNHQFEFQYPENWQLRESQAERMPYEVTLESPRGGVWILNVFPTESNGQALAEDVVKSLGEQYDSIESYPVSEKFGAIETEGFNINFFYLDLLIEAHIRHFVTDSYTYILLFQAEDRIFQEELLVFSAITTSLINNLEQQVV